MSPLAKADLENILEYLLEFWNVNVASDFIRRFEDTCFLIAQSPKLSPFLSKNRNICKCVLTKHNTIYFIENEFNIEVLAVFDSR